MWSSPTQGQQLYKHQDLLRAPQHTPTAHPGPPLGLSSASASESHSTSVAQFQFIPPALSGGKSHSRPHVLIPPWLEALILTTAQ